MSTSFTEIYNMADIIKNDSRLVNRPINQIYALYYEYLKQSISYFAFDCLKSLENYIPFIQQEYSYTTSNTDKDYLLSPSPPSATPLNFYIGYRIDSEVNYTQVIDYSFNSSTNIITINEALPNGYELYISAYEIGQFIDDLSLTEKRILANGMLVPYDQEMLQKQQLLNQLVYSGNSKIYSQAQHLKEVKDVAENQYYKIVKSMINEYSYKTNSNLYGLGGGLLDNSTS